MRERLTNPFCCEVCVDVNWFSTLNVIAWWRFAFGNVLNFRFKSSFFASVNHLWDDKASSFSRVLSVKVVFAQYHNVFVSPRVRSSPDWSQCGQNWPAPDFKYKAFCQSGAKTSWSRASPDHQDELHRLLRHLHGSPRGLASPGSTRDQGKFGLDRFSGSLWESKLVGETDEVKFVSN